MGRFVGGDRSQSKLSYAYVMNKMSDDLTNYRCQWIAEALVLPLFCLVKRLYPVTGRGSDKQQP